jgi:hypothetical protein
MHDSVRQLARVVPERRLSVRKNIPLEFITKSAFQKGLRELQRTHHSKQLLNGIAARRER